MRDEEYAAAALAFLTVSRDTYDLAKRLGSAHREKVGA